MIYIKLFWTFLKIGLFTFGGGYAMLPLIQQEVLNNNWLTKEELIDFIAISESTPGPFAVNASTFIGMQTAGVVGAFFATLGVVLPSFVIILIVARVYEKFQKSKVVNGAMLGLKGVVVGLIASAILSTVISVFNTTVDIANIREIIAKVIILLALLVAINKKINPIIIIIVSAILGIVVKSFLI